MLSRGLTKPGGLIHPEAYDCALRLLSDHSSYTATSSLDAGAGEVDRDGNIEEDRWNWCAHRVLDISLTNLEKRLSTENEN